MTTSSNRPTKLELIRLRDVVEGSIRAFFRDEQLLEVRTAVRVACPGMEPNLRAFAAGKAYLHTSPEIAIKSNLAEIGHSVFTFASVFRDEPPSPDHNTEFTMLEWYRLHGDLEQLRGDCENIVNAALIAVGAAPQQRPFARNKIDEVFRSNVGRSVIAATASELLDIAASADIDVQPDWDWETLFSILYIDVVEATISEPTFVDGFPASQAALAKIDPADPRVSLRFELYLPRLGGGSIEIANAFDELTDASEQRRRFEHDNAERRRIGEPEYPIPEAMLAGIERLPQTAGIALGVERLCVWVASVAHGWRCDVGDFILR